MAWLTGYTYRKKITITGQSGAGTNYQVKLQIGNASGGNFNLSSHAQSFPNDIRFTDSGGSVPLDYWIEDVTASPITVWINVADSLDSNVDIYCYYDKASDTTTSSGINTFDFFDDMSTNTIGINWFVVNKTPSISGGTLSIGPGCIPDCAIRSKALPFNPNGHVFQFKNKVDSYDYCKDNHYAGVETSANYANWNFYSGTGSPTKIGFNDSTVSTNGGGSTTGVWYKIVGKVLPTGTIVEVYNGATLVLTASSSNNYATTSHHMFFGYFSTAELDDVILRKYISPEPTFGTIGTEEIPTPSNILATDMTVHQSETPCIIGTCTISVSVTWTNYGDSTGSFVPSITFTEINIPTIPQEINQDKIIGIDVGLEKLATLSNGKIVEAPEYLRESEKKLAKYQRRLSRKKKYEEIVEINKRISKGEKADKEIEKKKIKVNSKNREKQIIKVRKIHRKITNQRRNFSHEVSRTLVDNFDVIAFEKLNIQNMVKNHRLAKSISDASWYQIQMFTNYKAECAGKTVIFVDPKNTSQLCSRCENKEHLELKDRIFRCSKCGLILDRDINAAINIKNRGIKELLINKKIVTPGTGDRACLSSPNRDTMIQEAAPFRGQ